MNQPLADGALWNHLTKEQKANLNNLILIIDANDLRKIGVNIGRYLEFLGNISILFEMRFFYH